jgi:hypothetical protein
METLGQLTGGVAHDFNNLLAFSRRQPLAPRPVLPNALVAGMGDLLHRTLGKVVAVRTEPAPEDWLVEVDANQLESALLNLAVNARDAMPGGGMLTLSIACLTLAEPICGQSEVPAGDHVLIAVTDTGKGTGLRLSMVYGFVKQSGGHIHLQSDVGAGTTVRIYLPRLLVSKTDAAATEQPGSERRGGPRDARRLAGHLGQTHQRFAGADLLPRLDQEREARRRKDDDGRAMLEPAHLVALRQSRRAGDGA